MFDGMIQEQLAIALKKMFFEFLKEDYHNHEKAIERISDIVRTRNDYKLFGDLMSKIYEKGYLLAIAQHKDILKKLGYKTFVKTPEVEASEEQKIFKKSQADNPPQ